VLKFRAMRTTTLVTTVALMLGGCGGGGGDEDPPLGDLFPEKPECEGDAIAPFTGSSPVVISKLEIGALEDGFDLDGDGLADNKLSSISGLAEEAIKEAIDNYEILLPFEFFDLDGAAPDTCVKFAIYVGTYVNDTDDDRRNTYLQDGECNDHDPAINDRAVEVPGNGKDDDCDGLADEDGLNNPSPSTADNDGDLVTINGGDCDDTNPDVHLGAVEICGDGFDNDCDGLADRTEPAVEGDQPTCGAFAGDAEIALLPASFVDGEPAVAFDDGVITSVDGVLQLDAGPSVFGVTIPIMAGVALDLRITGATLRAEVVEQDGKIALVNGRLGGVIDAKTADTIRGLDVPDIGLTPDKSLLDATFANILGPFLALPKAPSAIVQQYPGCRTPDIDVDRDGLESYCDSTPDDEDKTVDVCVDGDGTEFRDVVAADGSILMECTEALKGDKSRFVDGISVELNFETAPLAGLIQP
jgi:hypothetical protein